MANGQGLKFFLWLQDQCDCALPEESAEVGDFLGEDVLEAAVLGKVFEGAVRELSLHLPRLAARGSDSAVALVEHLKKGLLSYKLVRLSFSWLAEFAGKKDGHGICKGCFALFPPYLEHERVGPRVEPGVAEHRLDGVVRAEHDRGLGADLEREDVAVLPGESGEGAAEVQHVQEGQVAEEGDADGARGQQGPRGLAVVSPVVAATSGVRHCGSLPWFVWKGYDGIATAVKNSSEAVDIHTGSKSPAWRRRGRPAPRRILPRKGSGTFSQL